MLRLEAREGDIAAVEADAIANAGSEAYEAFSSELSSPLPDGL